MEKSFRVTFKRYNGGGGTISDMMLVKGENFTVTANSDLHVYAGGQTGHLAASFLHGEWIACVDVTAEA